MTKRVIKHEIKLEKSVKIILAALAVGVLAHAFVPTFTINSALARAHNILRSTGTMNVRVVGPVRLSGQVGLGGTLGLKGAVKCDGCVPKKR